MKQMLDRIPATNAMNFDYDVTWQRGLTLVDFWAPWSSPVAQLGPLVEEIAVRLKDKVTSRSVNCDKERKLVDRFAIKAFPTFIIFQDGVPVFRDSGLLGLNGVIKKIEELSQ